IIVERFENKFIIEIYSYSPTLNSIPSSSSSEFSSSISSSSSLARGFQTDKVTPVTTVPIPKHNKKYIGSITKGLINITPCGIVQHTINDKSIIKVITYSQNNVTTKRSTTTKPLSI